MRFSLFCGITKPKLRKIVRKCKRAYILLRGSGRGAAEVRKRGGKTGPQPSVPAVCGAGRRPAQLPAAAVCDGGAQPAERPHEATAKLRASAAGGCGPRGSIEPQPVKVSKMKIKMKTKTEITEPRTPLHPVALRHAPLLSAALRPPANPAAMHVRRGLQKQ